MTDPSDSTTMHPLTFIADFVVEAGDALHQLPLLTAAHEVDKVARQDFLELTDAETLDVFHTAQVREGGGPGLRGHGLFRVPRLLGPGIERIGQVQTRLWPCLHITARLQIGIQKGCEMARQREMVSTIEQ